MIRRLSAALNDKMKARLAQRELTLDQFGILMTLAEADGLTQTEIGARVRFPGYTVTRALDTLSAQGLVERRPDAQSRRSHRVVMTAAGRARMQGLFDIVERMNADFLAPLAEADRRQFLALLTRLVEADQDVKSPR
jgi:DNA-binding MarR family transcriptional regulator